MTEKQLNNLYNIGKRITRLKRRIAELEEELGISGQNLTGMPHGSSVSNPIEALVMKKCELLERLKKTLEEQIDEEMKLRAYIESIEDAEIKLIFELRFLDLMNWDAIGKEMNMDRTTASKKMQNYLANH